ncbi:homogentisate 1,2-dioxygenase [compost metagenome]|jgi:alcohol dehydrogenase class IV
MMANYHSRSHALRVHAGVGALDALENELRQAGVGRALLLTGRTVAKDQAWMDDLQRQSGGRIAGLFCGIGKEAPLEDLQGAVCRAREIQADGLIALGAGSVIKAARVVAILLAEPGPVDALVTQYPAGGAAVSPRLLAPKLPIFNILTAPTSAQARGGSAVLDGGARLEFFDPKTRPRCVFWDTRALASAPPSLAVRASFTVYWRALMSMASVTRANPLVQASRRQAWTIAQEAFASQRPFTPDVLLDLCAAALLQNRDEDDGGRPMDAHSIASQAYALAAAVFHVCPQVSQADAYAALTPAIIQLAPDSADELLAGLAQALGCSPDRAGLAARLRREWLQWGMSTALDQLGVREAHWPAIRELASHNFNADRDGQFAAQAGRMRALFDAALTGA